MQQVQILFCGTLQDIFLLIVFDLFIGWLQRCEIYGQGEGWLYQIDVVRALTSAVGGNPGYTVTIAELKGIASCYSIKYRKLVWPEWVTKIF